MKLVLFFLILFTFSCAKQAVEENTTTSTVCGFERPPYIATVEFKNGATTDGTALLFGIHVKPDKVYYELNMLDDVMEEESSVQSNNNLIALGDFNADCSYLSDGEYNTLDLIQKSYSFPISKTQDTNVASSSCAYDRFAYKVSGISIGSTGIQTSSIDSSISDHYLIHTTVTANSNPYKIAAFNLERYGPTKAGNSTFTNAVKTIFQNYDLVLLQEITSTDQSVINSILPSGYSYNLSDRLGSTSYKEQYAYIYNNKINITNAKVYNGELCVTVTKTIGPDASCTSDGYYCGLDLYVTPGGQCRSRNKNGSNLRVRDCCCGI